NDTASEYLPQVETVSNGSQPEAKDAGSTEHLSVKPMVYGQKAADWDTTGGANTDTGAGMPGTTAGSDWPTTPTPTPAPGDTGAGNNNPGAGSDWGGTTNGGTTGAPDLISQLLKNQNTDAQTANTIAGLLGKDGSLSDADHQSLNQILANQQGYGDVN